MFVSHHRAVAGAAPPDLVEVAMSVAVLPGVALVVGGTPDGHAHRHRRGRVLGAGGGVFSTLNKRAIGTSPALTVTGLQMAAGAVLLPPWRGCCRQASGARASDLRDGLLLVALSMACTLLPYTLALVALRHLSAFDTTLAVNMEPVYAIVLAIVLLNEQRDLEPSFYLRRRPDHRDRLLTPVGERRWGRLGGATARSGA